MQYYVIKERTICCDDIKEDNVGLLIMALKNIDVQFCRFTKRQTANIIDELQQRYVAKDRG